MIYIVRLANKWIVPKPDKFLNIMFVYFYYISNLFLLQFVQMLTHLTKNTINSSFSINLEENFFNNFRGEELTFLSYSFLVK